MDPERFAKVTTFGDTLMWSEVPEDAQYEVAHDQAYGPIIETLDRTQRIAILRASDWEDTTGMRDSQVANLAGALTLPELYEHLRYVMLNGGDTLSRVLDDDQRIALQRVIDLERADILPIEGDLVADGLSISRNGQPGIVAGIHVSDANFRDSNGDYQIGGGGHWWLPRYEGALTTIPVDATGGTLEPETEIMPFVNEFSSGVSP